MQRTKCYGIFVNENRLILNVIFNIATYLTGNNVVVPLDELMTDEKYGFSGSNVNGFEDDLKAFVSKNSDGSELSREVVALRRYGKSLGCEKIILTERREAGERCAEMCALYVASAQN